MFGKINHFAHLYESIAQLDSYIFYDLLFVYFLHCAVCALKAYRLLYYCFVLLFIYRIPDLM